MNILKGIQNKVNGKDSASNGGADDGAPEGADPEDTSVLDDNQGSIILSLISQLRIGMDLHKIAFPTFVLEPRSMLERVTDFMTHAELLFNLDQNPSARERFLTVLQYYMSGWHIRPKGVKKPYNPALREMFRCRYRYKDGSEGFYVAEQVSHHPPVSAFFYFSPAHKISIVGELRPKSKFLGNSVQTIMDGENRIQLLGTDDGEYVITLPNMFARGILFGKLVFELGDSITATNERTGMSADVDFKTKGFFSGTYNVVKGEVKDKGQTVGEISGKWSHHIEYKDASSGEAKVWFDESSSPGRPEMYVAPEEEQEPHESRKLWSKVTTGIRTGDQSSAQEAKSALEDNQRKFIRGLEEGKETYEPTFFVKGDDGKWGPKFRIPKDVQGAGPEVERWLWPDGKAPKVPPQGGSTSV